MDVSENIQLESHTTKVSIYIYIQKKHIINP